MKAIIYVGAVLMTGAIIYGFVDYSKVSRSKDFNSLYEQPEATKPVITTPEVKTEVTDVKKNNELKKTRIAVKRKGLKNNYDKKDSQESNRDVIPVTPLYTEKTEKVLPLLKDEKTESALKEIKKKKRLNYRMFSRAPLKEMPSVKNHTKSKE